MPAEEPASRYAELRRAEASAPKVLYAVDASDGPDSAARDLDALTEAALAAVRAGDGHVLSTAHAVYPNGAITLVLILAESHLSEHTLPDQNLVAVDLFSCGAIDGETVISSLIGALRLQSTQIRRMPRGL